MLVALFGKKIYLTLKLTFDLELWQNKSRNQKRPLLKIFHLVQVSFVPSGIILLQNAVGMSLTCPLCVLNTKTAFQDLTLSGLRVGMIHSWNPAVVEALVPLTYFGSVPAIVQNKVARILADSCK